MVHSNRLPNAPASEVAHILVVDDDESTRSALVRLLEQNGYSADSAENGLAALRAAQEQPPDVVVTDLMMPGMDGVELLRRLKRQNSETLVIVLTSFGDVGSAVSAMRAGAEDYLAKPVDFYALALTVERALEKRSLRIEVEGMRSRVLAQQARLSRLYEISKLLTRFESIALTVPQVLGLLNDSVPLRTAVLMVERAEDCSARAIAWLAENVSPAELDEARAQARKSYAYLCRQASRVDDEFGAKRLPSTIPPSRESKREFIFLPLVVEHEQTFGGLQIEVAAGLDEADLAFVNAVVNQLAIALDRVEAIEAKLAADRASLRAAEFLADASATMFSSLEYESTIAAVLRAAIPPLADVCLLHRVSEDGSLERQAMVLASAGGGAPRVRHLAMASDAEALQRQALRSGEALVLTNPRPATHFEGELEFSALMIVPLIARGQGLGVLTFVATESARQYSPSDLALAREIGRRAAIAIDNAQLYEQAQRAILARQDLMASVSHDLKNPLGSILMASNLLGDAAASSDVQTRVKHCAVIERSVRRMNRLLADLLDIASIEAGRLALEVQSHPVAPLLCEAIDMNEALARRNELKLEGFAPDEGLEIECDRDRVLQVFGNLIGNAIKFTAKGGSIRVAARRADGEVLFSVTDSGRGIEPNELAHVFDRFWQARRTARLGTGLGLAITKALVEAHRGRIWAESKVGEGTTFFFTIPLAA